MPRIVYIAGYGRSGSTLLDILLGNHPRMFGVGEVSAFFQEWSGGTPCSCGHSLEACPFWSEVIDRLRAALPDLTPLAAEQITRKVEVARIGRLAPGGDAEDHKTYSRLWRAFMVAVSQASGRDIVIDSSKNSRPVSRRIAGLTELCGFDVRVIHLIRDPRATMWSALRGANRALEQGQQGTVRGGAYKALLGWWLANLSVHRTTTMDRQLRVFRLRYEDLVSHPGQELQKLGAFLELDLTSVIDEVVNYGPFEPGHGIKGNRMRRAGPVRLKLDEEWKTALPTHARMLAPLSWPLANRYGYKVLRSARQ